MAHHVEGVRGNDDLEPGDHHGPVLDRLGMLGAETQTASVARTDHQWKGQLTVGHVATLGDLVGDDVPTDREEVGEHDLGDRTQPRHGGTHRGSEDRLLTDGRVTHAYIAELLEQTHGAFKDPARRAHVLAQHHDGRVAAHLLGDAPRDCLAVRQLRHAAPPSAHTSFNKRSSPGMGPAFASSVANSTSRRTDSSIAARSSSATPASRSRVR